MGKKRIYSPEFKLSVVQAVKCGRFSADSARFYFGIANSGVISQWLQAFDKQGIKRLIAQTKRSSDNETEIPGNATTIQNGRCAFALSYFRIGSGGGYPKKVAGVQPSKNAEIERKIAEIFHENDGNYGYRRMTLVLRRIWTINHKKVQAIMQNEKWVTDVSEFKCVEGKLYLSPIKDLFNDEIIAYDLARSPNFE